MSITFETKVWKNDWEAILKTGRIKQIINSYNYSFDKRILYINNVKNIDIVLRVADALVFKQVITKYILVEEFVQQALDSFSLSKNKLGKGCYYLIAELVSIYLTDTQYLLYFPEIQLLLRGSKETGLAKGLQHSNRSLK